MIDLTKPVQTRDGRKARILATDLKCVEGKRLAVAIETLPGSEALYYYRLDGKSVDNNYDLVNVPERVSVFGAVFSDGSFGSASCCFKNPGSHKYWLNTNVLEVVFEDGVPVDAIIHKGS